MSSQILVVDDDDSIREFVGEVLADEGYEVLSAAHGREALDVLTRHQPVVIFLDLAMPVMDGREFLRQYRAGPGPHAPIVLVAAARNVAEVAHELDLKHFLGKPFELDELLSAAAYYACSSQSAGGVL